jgi:hypothetical protein
MLSGFAEVGRLVPGFCTLTVAGLILGFAYYQTRTLYFSIGLHAGWIFWLKFYGLLTNSQPGASTWFWGTSKLIDGWLALMVMIPIFPALWFARRKMAASHAA